MRVSRVSRAIAASLFTVFSTVSAFPQALNIPDLPVTHIDARINGPERDLYKIKIEENKARIPAGIQTILKERGEKFLLMADEKPLPADMKVSSTLGPESPNALGGYFEKERLVILFTRPATYPANFMKGLIGPNYLHDTGHALDAALEYPSTNDSDFTRAYALDLEALSGAPQKEDYRIAHMVPRSRGGSSFEDMSAVRQEAFAEIFARWANPVKDDLILKHFPQTSAAAYGIFAQANIKGAYLQYDLARGEPRLW